jgi:hypothetical protein
MIKYKYIYRFIEEIEDIICDMCGGSCKKDLDILDCIIIDHKWGYGSNLDGEQWTAHICADCAENKLKPLIKFKIKDWMSYE